MFSLERAGANRPVTWLSLVGVLLVPILVALGFLAATWQSADRLHRVEAAVVNNDEMVTINDQAIPLGRQLAAGLVERRDDNFTWVLADESHAAAGLESGRYVAVVTIPKDFSAAATSFSGPAGDARQATIGVQTSDITGIADAAIVQVIADTAKSTVNRSLTETYLDNIFIGYNEVGEQFQTIAEASGEIADGQDGLANGLGESADGAGELAAGTTAYADGVGEVATGTSDLAAGMNQLAAGGTELATGGNTLGEGAAELAAGGEPLRDGTGQLADGLGQLGAAGTELSGGTTQLAGGAGQLGTGLRTMADQTAALPDQTRQLADGIRELADGVGALAGGLDELDAGMAPLSEGSQQLADGAAANADGVEQYVDGVQQLNDGIQQMAGGMAAMPPVETEQLDQIAASLGQIQAGAGRVADRMEAFENAPCPTPAGVELTAEQQAAVCTAWEDAKGDLVAPMPGGGSPGQWARAIADSPELAQGLTGAAEMLPRLAELGAGVGQLAEGSQQLADGGDQLVVGANGLADGAAGLNSGIGELAGGVGQLAGGADQAAGGADALADGTAQLADGMPALVDGIGQSATGAEALATGAGTLAGGVTAYTDGVGQTAAGAQDLAAGVEQYTEGAGTLASGIDSYADGVGTFTDGVSATANGTQELSSGLNQLAAGGTELADGTTALADGLGQAAGGARQLADGQREMADGLATGAEQVPTYSEADRENLKQVIAEPVARNTTSGTLIPAATSTSLLLVLALWLGGLCTYLVVRPITGRALTSTRPSWQLLAQSLLPGAAIAVVQSIVLAILAQQVVDLSGPTTGAVLAMLVLGSLTFVALNHALVAWFGGVGRLVSVVLVTLTAAAGVISALPVFFDTALPLSPLTPVLHGLRAIITDGSGVTDAVGMTVFWLIIGVGASLGAILRSRRVSPRAMAALATSAAT